MNIRELGYKYGLLPVMDSDEEIFVGNLDELESYTKSIVNECLEIMTSELWNTSMLLSNPPQSSAIWDARNKIKTRFGVK
jgi:hypothetical protein